MDNFQQTLFATQRKDLAQVVNCLSLDYHLNTNVPSFPNDLYYCAKKNIKVKTIFLCMKKMKNSHLFRQVQKLDCFHRHLKIVNLLGSQEFSEAVLTDQKRPLIQLTLLMLLFHQVKIQACFLLGLVCAVFANYRLEEEFSI